MSTCECERGACFTYESSTWGSIFKKIKSCFPGQEYQVDDQIAQFIAETLHVDKNTRNLMELWFNHVEKHPNPF